MAAAVKIALLGADEPLGEVIIRLIGERELDFGEIIPISLDESDRCATIAGEQVPLQAAAGFDWSDVAAVVSVSRAVVAQRHLERARQAGCEIIGVGGAATTNAAALAIARVIAPLARRAGLRALDAVVTLPVCMAGQAGIEELAAQTRALFAMEDVESETFPLQVAFNLIPQVGDLLADGVSSFEVEATAAIRVLLGLPDLPITVSACWGSLFYGGAIVIHGETDEPLTAEGLRALLANRPGIVHMDAQLPGGIPTPATDAQDSEDVFVGRVRTLCGTRHGFALWLVIDMLRLEAAQIVDQLEKAVAGQAASVLT